MYVYRFYALDFMAQCMQHDDDYDSALLYRYLYIYLYTHVHV
jgi:hypothetical protein